MTKPLHTFNKATELFCKHSTHVNYHQNAVKDMHLPVQNGASLICYPRPCKYVQVMHDQYNIIMHSSCSPQVQIQPHGYCSSKSCIPRVWNCANDVYTSCAEVTAGGIHSYPMLALTQLGHEMGIKDYNIQTFPWGRPYRPTFLAYPFSQLLHSPLLTHLFNCFKFELLLAYMLPLHHTCVHEKRCHTFHITALRADWVRCWQT